MAVSLALLQSLLEQGLAPAALLGRLDQTIAVYTRTNRQNCALVCVELNRAVPHRNVAHATAAYTICMGNAGAIPPLIRRADGTILWEQIGGLPLGTTLAGRMAYQERAEVLFPGDMVILVSDGVVEARNQAGELFGFERLEQTVARGPAESAAAMRAYIQAVLATFTAGGEPSDDMTIVIMRV